MKRVPSPSVFVRADYSIRKCVELMKERNVGSILVLKEKKTGAKEIVGIFTERDLLHKVALICEHSHLERPIRTIMTSPIVTLQAKDIEKAGSLMLKHGFRHVPVVKKRKGGPDDILGVISMRDLYESLLNDNDRNIKAFLKKNYEASSKKVARIAVVENSKSTQTLLKEGFSFLGEVKANYFDFDEMVSDPLGIKKLRNHDVLIVDIDGESQNMWSKLLKKINDDPEVPLALVLFNPSEYKPIQVKILDKVGKSRKFFIYEKPINVFTLLYQISPFLFYKN